MSVAEGLRKGNDALARKDYVTAMRWFHQAADQGNAEAEYSVGELYTAGSGVTRDATEGMFWFRKAADQGHVMAQTMVGALYDLGDGVKQDFGQALVWYRRAAQQGNRVAEYRLGRMYILGRGVPADREAGTAWMRKAAQHGSPEARNYLQNPGSLVAQAAPEPPNAEPRANERVAQASEVPSDDEIINAIKANIKREVVQSIKAEYGNIDKFDAFGTGAMSYVFLMKGSPASVPAVLACSLNGPNEKRACVIEALAKLRAERDAKLRDARNDDAGRVFVFAVQSKANYEGNYVAFVTARQRGTDKTFEMKTLLVRKNGVWVATERHDKEIN